MRNTTALPALLSVTQAAKHLHMSPRTLLYWIQIEKVEATKVGGGKTSAYVITRDEVQRLHDDQAGKAAS